MNFQNFLNDLTTNRSVARLVSNAQRAGAAIGTGKQDDAYARLILMDSLNDDERERLGYATHMIAKAKQAGYTPAELWNYVQDGFNRSQRYLSGFFEVDEVGVGVLAFAAGACREDAAVSNTIRGYLKGVA
jgi:coproporphyrinogen III oxidase-like Fe-S oxidoreductase